MHSLLSSRLPLTTSTWEQAAQKSCLLTSPPSQFFSFAGAVFTYASFNGAWSLSAVLMGPGHGSDFGIGLSLVGGWAAIVSPNNFIYYQEGMRSFFNSCCLLRSFTSGKQNPSPLQAWQGSVPLCRAIDRHHDQRLTCRAPRSRPRPGPPFDRLAFRRQDQRMQHRNRRTLGLPPQPRTPPALQQRPARTCPVVSED